MNTFKHSKLRTMRAFWILHQKKILKLEQIAEKFNKYCVGTYPERANNDIVDMKIDIIITSSFVSVI